MRNIPFIAAMFMAASTVTFADNHAGDMPQWGAGAPLEIYGCKFKDGINGYEQSQKFAKSWNEWADANEAF